MSDTVKIQLQKSRRGVGHGKNRRWPIRDSTQYPEQCRAKDADQDSSVELSRHQHHGEAKAQACGLHFFVSEVSQTDIRGRICNYQLGIAQSNKSNKHSDSRGSG